MLITLITPTYNCVDSLDSTFESIHSQKYKEFEHIVVDGNSNDGTTDKLKSYPNIDKLIIEPDYGIYDALNKGINNSSGKVVGIMHAGDLFADCDVLQVIADTFRHNESIDAIYGDLEYISFSTPNKVVRHWNSNKFSNSKLRSGWMPPHPTLYVKKDWYRRHGLFCLDFQISSDYHKILQFFSDPTFNSSYIPQVLVRMKLGGKSNSSLKNIILKSHEDYIILRKMKFSFFHRVLTLSLKNISKLNQFFKTN